MEHKTTVNATVLQKNQQAFERLLDEARIELPEATFDVLVDILTHRVARLNFERLPVIERGEIPWP